MDVFALVTKDHQNIRALLRFLEESESIPQADELFAELDRSLRMHTLAADEVLYPAIYSALKIAGAAERAYAEHTQARKLLSDLRQMNPTSPDYLNTVRQLHTAIEHHLKQEEKLFPKIKKAMKPDQLSRLADAFRATEIRIKNEETYLDLNDDGNMDREWFEDPRRRFWGHPEKLATRYNRKTTGRWSALERVFS